ncbi:hypothetical protein ALON55S_04159 [Alishewanella longhuensis]
MRFFDPSHRIEPLLLNRPAPFEAPNWTPETTLSDKTRYEALYFLSAAFGDKEKIQQIKQQAVFAMAFTVTKGLLDAAGVLQEEVTIKDPLSKRGQGRLIIKSQYQSTDNSNAPSSAFWTSSKFEEWGTAFIVNFNNGGESLYYHIENNVHVRLVRSGQ